jgi:hypothetical protein
MSNPLLSAAIAESTDIARELAEKSGGRTVLAFYVALLRLAKTMETRYPELRPVREPVLECGDGPEPDAVGAN